MTPNGGTRSTTRRLMQVLQALAAAEDGLGVRETSRSTGIDKSAVGRLLTQLQDLDMVTQDPTSGRYRVGPKLFALGAALVARDSLTQAAHPILGQLARRLNETCYLAVREPGGFTFRDKVECTNPVRYVIELGLFGHFHAGAAGRAILAGMSEDELDTALAETPLEPLTDATITDLVRLREVIAHDRRSGYSFSRGERVRGGTAIAAPFFDAAATCRGSIVFTRPAVRHRDDDLKAIAGLVIEAASQMSSRLGYMSAVRRA